MKRLTHFLSGLLMLITIWLAVPLDAAAQCPMCKAAVESNTNYGEDGNWLASMLNTGIFYLFALPYLSIMGIGFFWYRGYKRRQRAEARDQMVTIESVLGKSSESHEEAPS